MRINVSSRLALVAALGVVASTLGAYGLRPSATATFAAPPPPLTTGDFHEVAVQGFGDRANSEAWSMEWFNHKLYVGDNRNYGCTKRMMWNSLPIIGPLLWPYPPKDPDMVCPGRPPRVQDLPPTEAAEIWALDPTSATGPLTQSNWTLAYQDPYNSSILVGKAKVAAPRDMGWRGMSIFTEPDGAQALYVSGVGVKPIASKSANKDVVPPSLLRSLDGVHFRAVPAAPGTLLGDINTLSSIKSLLGTGACCFRGQVSYNGRFVVLIGSIQGAGAVFESPDPSKGNNNFWQLTPPNMQVFELAPFNGHLYLGLQSSSGGYSVVRTDCISPLFHTTGCPASAFKEVVPPGGGLGKNGNFSITAMKVYTDSLGQPHLYVGTDGATNKTAAEVIRVNKDDSWDLIVGDARMIGRQKKFPLSGLTSGFGWHFNYHMWRMEDYNGALYVGTFDESTFQKNLPSARYLEPWMGFDLYVSTDGVKFTPITQNGFGDKFSYGARTLKATPYGLFVGSANEYYGLRVWQGQLSQDAPKQAPNDVQGDTDSGAGTAALSWNAPSGATLFHIYRSAATQMVLPIANNETAVAPDNDAGTRAVPTRLWIPSPYVEIGTSTAPYFVDHDVQPGKQYSYYVVAQDAAGNLSMKSDVAMVPSVQPLPTFRAMRALLSEMVSEGTLSSGQADGVNRALTAAQARLAAGDVAGCRDALDALRGQVLSSAQGENGSAGAERLAFVLGHLEQRIGLIAAHILSAATVG